MSEDGKTILVGGPGTQSHNGSSKGFISVFKYKEPVFTAVGGPVDTTAFELLSYIEGKNTGDRFGFSVDMVKFMPEYIAVGAPGDKSVSVFRG